MFEIVISVGFSAVRSSKNTAPAVLWKDSMYKNSDFTNVACVRVMCYSGIPLSLIHI